MRAADHSMFKEITVAGSGRSTIDYKNLLIFEGAGLQGDLAMLTIKSEDITGGKNCPWTPKVLFDEFQKGSNDLL